MTGSSDSPILKYIVAGVTSERTAFFSAAAFLAASASAFALASSSSFAARALSLAAASAFALSRALLASERASLASFHCLGEMPAERFQAAVLPRFTLRPAETEISPDTPLGRAIARPL